MPDSEHRTLLSPLRMEVIRLLAIDGEPINSIADELEMDPATVQRALEILEAAGRLPRCGEAT